MAKIVLPSLWIPESLAAAGSSVSRSDTPSVVISEPLVSRMYRWVSPGPYDFVQSSCRPAGQASSMNTVTLSVVQLVDPEPVWITKIPVRGVRPVR